MRHLILIILTAFTLYFANAQFYNEEINGKSLIVEVDSSNQKTINSKIMTWIALNYKSANDVVQLNTDEKIIVKGSFTVNSNKPFPDLFNAITYFSVDIDFSHTLVISIRENKFKIDISFLDRYKTITYLDLDWYFLVNEYTLKNEFTIEDQYEIAKANLLAQYDGNEKKTNRKFNNRKSYYDANYKHEKEVANKLNQNIQSILLGLQDSVKSKNNDW
ncbi:hypothetical protein N9D26_00195 [bacterium]|nr:hypothetical protein [bacterium]